MPWHWQGRGTETSSVGSPAEARIAHAWPNYEADYLAKRLQTKNGKYNTSNLDAAEQVAYLNKISQDYKEEADISLKHEFDLWLQGMHEDNRDPQVYTNGGTKPKRIELKHGNDVGRLKSGWRPTHWGTKQLTHLNGVRDYLRSQEEASARSNLYMNMLAEYGPQDLESAWMYFKHWVKGRPVGPDEHLMDEPNNREKSLTIRSPGFSMPPEYVQRNASVDTDIAFQHLWGMPVEHFEQRAQHYVETAAQKYNKSSEEIKGDLANVDFDEFMDDHDQINKFFERADEYLHHKYVTGIIPEEFEEAPRPHRPERRRTEFLDDDAVEFETIPEEFEEAPRPHRPERRRTNFVSDPAEVFSVIDTIVNRAENIIGVEVNRDTSLLNESASGTELQTMRLTPRRLSQGSTLSNKEQFRETAAALGHQISLLSSPIQVQPPPPPYSPPQATEKVLTPRRPSQEKHLSGSERAREILNRLGHNVLTMPKLFDTSTLSDSEWSDS